MKKRSITAHIRYALIALFVVVFVACKGREVPEGSIAYINGWVYNGREFEKRDFAVLDGLLHFDSGNKAKEVIDLNGKYVIPPFGDAHTHNFDDPAVFDSIYQAYVDEGTFYVQVLTNHQSRYLRVKDSLNRTGKIDAAFAHGGLTSTGGHPHTLYETQALGYSWRAMFDPEKKDEILRGRSSADDAYYLIDSLDDLDAKWDAILSNHPDILKIYVYNTNSRESRIQERQLGTYGLSEAVVQEVVRRAGDSGIRVWAHVQSVSDFEMALRHGITHYAHMPGYGGGIGKVDFEGLTVSDSTLQSLTGKNIVMSPTVSFAKYYATAWDGSKMALDTVMLDAKYEFLKTQLRRFHDAGVQIVLGADQYNATLGEEIRDLITINAFSNQELLNILTAAPKVIFPDKNIGALKQGYEASFLVLSNNPLEEIKAIWEIEERVKNGIPLPASQP